jgi:hypothetical protein
MCRSVSAVLVGHQLGGAVDVLVIHAGMVAKENPRHTGGGNDGG